MSLVGTVLLNITSSFIYDLVKCSNNRTRKKTIESLVQKNILINDCLVENSGSLEKFFLLYSTKLCFQNFIRYNSFKKHYKDHEIDIPLNKQKFIQHIADSAIQFVKKDVNRTINFLDMKSYVEKVLNIIEQKIIDELPKELIAIPYYINLAMQELQEKMFEMIDEKENNANYEEIRQSYVKIIRERYKKNHVYGIDKLELSQFYVFPQFCVEEKRSEDAVVSVEDENLIIEWEKVFNISNIISIIGGPGFGKTLFLKNLINNYSKLDIFNCDEIMPIYCNLKEFSTFSLKNSTAYSIDDFLVDSIIHTSGLDRSKITKDFLNFYMQSGRCLLLFDALDEVDNEDRERIAEVIVSFFKTSNKNNKVCITTRERGLIPETPVILRVLPINKHQIKIYLRKMSVINRFDSEDIELFLDQCKPLIENNFLTNFLMVALMVNIFTSERELPETKVQLYKSCTEYISRKREIKDKKVKFNYDIIRSMVNNDETFEQLSFLGKRNNKEVSNAEIEKCLRMTYDKLFLDQNQLINAIDEFLKFCSERTELYVEGNEGYYRFFHRSFFEYYYSKFIIKSITCNTELINELLNFSPDSEMFELTVSLLKSEYYSRYELFLDDVFSMIEQNTLLDKKSIILRMITDFMFISEEEYFQKKYYNLCFGERRLLEDLSFFDDDPKIKTILTRYNSEAKIYNDLLKYYRLEVISSFIIYDSLMNDIVAKVSHTTSGIAKLFINFNSYWKNDDVVKEIRAITYKEYLEVIKKYNITFEEIQVVDKDNVLKIVYENLGSRVTVPL
ncbi:NACHT domain-containing protein [Paenibacillus terrigena]|uniref:NACHT domain-containing protein n=1 Tax=Paenibacillus terrigena TaxID=369333 RepID=UPI0028D43C50|nr:NACHT domain-containing protein [Paenibacillus terrigena]